MESVREAWTDERLDDLGARMDAGLARVHTDLREVRSELSTMQRTMILGFASVIASGFVSVIGSVVVTKL
jgi:hypothetical protein